MNFHLDIRHSYTAEFSHAHIFFCSRRQKKSLTIKINDSKQKLKKKILAASRVGYT